MCVRSEDGGIFCLWRFGVDCVFLCCAVNSRSCTSSSRFHARVMSSHKWAILLSAVRLRVSRYVRGAARLNDHNHRSDKKSRKGSYSEPPNNSETRARCLVHSCTAAAGKAAQMDWVAITLALPRRRRRAVPSRRQRGREPPGWKRLPFARAKLLQQ